LTLGWMDPGWSGQPIELQGGEQKTHTFTVAFGESGITDQTARLGSVALAGLLLARSGTLAAKRCRTSRPNRPTRTPLYLKLVDQAIEGPDTFLA